MGSEGEALGPETVFFPFLLMLMIAPMRDLFFPICTRILFMSERREKKN